MMGWKRYEKVTSCKHGKCWYLCSISGVYQNKWLEPKHDLCHKQKVTLRSHGCQGFIPLKIPTENLRLDYVFVENNPPNTCYLSNSHIFFGENTHGIKQLVRYYIILLGP